MMLLLFTKRFAGDAAENISFRTGRDHRREQTHVFHRTIAAMRASMGRYTEQGKETYDRPSEKLTVAS